MRTERSEPLETGYRGYCYTPLPQYFILFILFSELLLYLYHVPMYCVLYCDIFIVFVFFFLFVFILGIPLNLVVMHCSTMTIK